MEENRPKKILLMQITVTILAIFILLIWVFNLKNIWRNNQQTSATSDQESWVKLKTDLNKTLADIQGQLGKINKVAVPQASTSSTDFLVNLLKNTKSSTSPSAVDIVMATTTVATSSIVSTSSIATTTFEAETPLPVDKQNNCPKYINCMPTIGSAPVCQIPVGCEGITALVY
ncbi:MAG: hypothetical protein WC249_00440 [Patescibacteria group bacterium]|jgi:hypothetical protein